MSGLLVGNNVGAVGGGESGGVAAERNALALKFAVFSQIVTSSNVCVYQPPSCPIDIPLDVPAASHDKGGGRAAGEGGEGPNLNSTAADASVGRGESIDATTSAVAAGGGAGAGMGRMIFCMPTSIVPGSDPECLVVSWR